ncbi:MAG: undecaprenyl-diphosphate phosphatase [Acetivibrionales bacterium]
MTVIQAFILGIVQGLAEFLPISSSGHLVMLQKLFGIDEGGLTFDIAVHLATLAAVIVVYKKDILEILKRPFGKLPLLIVAGTIPTAIIGFLFKDIFESVYASGITLGFGFIVTGLVLWYADSIKTKNKSLKEANTLDAVVVGIAQGIAILPAVSRSGLTISGALFRGLNREFALKFSFLMSIPAILGAAVLDIYDLVKAPGNLQLSIGIPSILVGMAAAAVSGYFAVKFMINILKKGKIKVFSYYVFALGALVLIDQIFFGRFFGKMF